MKAKVRAPAAVFQATPRWMMYAAMGAIVLIYVALRWPGLGVPLDRDEGAFGYMGQLIHQGGLPYRDGLDHKPPVVFYLNALALYFVPATARGIHAALAVYNFATLAALGWLGWVYFESIAAGLWTALAFAVFSASPSIQGFTASTEMFALLPVTLSVLFAVMGVKRDRVWMIFASGVAGALACWTKQTEVACALFALLYAIVAADRARRVIAGAAWMGGAVAISGAIGLYFYARGAFGQFIYWTFTYGFTYVGQASASDTLSSVQDAAGEIAAGEAVVLAAALGAIVFGLVRKKSWAWFLAGFFVLSIAATLPGFGYTHYFAQVAPAMAIAAGEGFALVSPGVGRVRVRMAVVCGCAAAAMLVPVAVESDYFLERDPRVISRNTFDTNPFPESIPVADYIAEHTSARDGVLIIGSEPQILFYAQRRSPSPFLMIYPLMTVHARYKEFQETLLNDVRKDPPQYVVMMMHIGSSVAWDEKADLGVMQSLTAMVEREYVLDRVRLVGGVDGEWVAANDARIGQDTPFIAVFRRRG